MHVVERVRTVAAAEDDNFVAVQHGGVGATPGGGSTEDGGLRPCEGDCEKDELGVRKSSEDALVSR